MTPSPQQQRPAIAGPRRLVYLHVGSPKTGTTYLQGVLGRHRAGLRVVGVLYPGSGERDQFNAALDLRGLKFGGHDDPAVPGAWTRLVEEVRAWPGTAIVSHEILAGASAEQAERAVSSFGAAEVHVVVTARDLVRQVPSMWQEHLKNRHTTRWQDYLGAVRRSQAEAVGRADGAHPGERFWRTQDVADVLRRWGAALPVHRLHVVTVPRPDAPRDLLWRRFTSLVGIDPDVFDGVAGRRNPSLGAVEAELLRRLNERLDESLPWPRYRQLVKRLLAEQILVAERSADRLWLNAEQAAWAEERSRGILEQIKAGGYDVVGDLAELVADVAQDAAPQAGTPDEASTGDLVRAAVAAITGFVVDLAEQRSVQPPADPLPPPESPPRPSAPRRLVAALRGGTRTRVERLRAARARQLALRAARARTDQPVVYVHVGLPKTGTTYLQATLAANREELHHDGVLYPHDRFNAHFFAALDLLGTGFRGHRYPAADGSWDRLAEQIRGWPGVSVISHEILFRATKEHARRLVASVAPAQVRIVITARDLARQLPAVWQEQLKLGQDYTWAEFVSAVLAADSSPAAALAGEEADDDLGGDEPMHRAGTGPDDGDDERQAVLRRFGRRFWRGRDPAAVAMRWADILPPERIHVVTVPAAGADEELLWQRFAAVVGLTTAGIQPAARGANTSLGPAEAELLRRLNPTLTERLSWEDYERHVKWGLAERALSGRAARRRMVLPPEQWQWIEHHSHRIVDQLSSAGFPVSGRLDDLIPMPPYDDSSSRRPDQTDDAEVLDAALDALAGLVHVRSGTAESPNGRG